MIVALKKKQLVYTSLTAERDDNRKRSGSKKRKKRADVVYGTLTSGDETYSSARFDADDVVAYNASSFSSLQ
jgi:hypothetical protein